MCGCHELVELGERVAVDGVALLCSAGPASAECQAPEQPEGVHSITARIRDAAGNSALAERGVRTVLDVTPPTVAILSPVDGTFIASPSPHISASFADEGSGIDTGTVRLLVNGVPALAPDCQQMLALLALASMALGNITAIAQSNLKRMLAYSSVAQAGYLLTALVAAPGLGTEAILFYLVAYSAVSLGGFGVFAALTRGGREPLTLSDVAGLSVRRPVVAAAMTVFLISLTGVPISGGFVGKFYLFSAAVSGGYTYLAVIGMVMSVVSAYYYLRVVVAMYFREPEGEDRWARPAPGASLALAVSTAVVVVLGVYPGPLMHWAGLAARSLR